MAGTTNVTYDTSVPGIEIITFSVVADASTGAIASATTSYAVHGWVTRVVTDPGGTAPTSLYDLTLSDADGCDVLGGEGANRSATVSEQIIPKVGNAFGPVRVDSALTLAGTNNSANSAIITARVYVEKD